MTKITVDKALIEQALESLKTCSGVPHWPALEPVKDALRAALAESVVKDCLTTEPAVEPVAYRYKYLNFMGDEVWSQDMPRNGKVLETQALYTSPTPPAEPRISTEHCSLAERQRHQASVNYPSDDLYCPRCQCSERFLQSKPCNPHIVYDAPPAEVPLLTPSEVALMWVSESFDTMSYESCYTRGVNRGEQAVRQKAGLV